MMVENQANDEPEQTSVPVFRFLHYLHVEKSSASALGGHVTVKI